MSLIYDDFTGYGSLTAIQNSYYLSDTVNSVFDGTGGAFGGPCIKLKTTGDYLYKVIDNHKYFACGILINITASSLADNACLIASTSSASTAGLSYVWWHWCIRLNADFSLSILKAGAIDVYTSPSGIIPAQQDVCIEVEGAHDQAAGSLKLLVNGAVLTEVTGIDTVYGSAVENTTVAFVVNGAYLGVGEYTLLSQLYFISDATTPVSAIGNFRIYTQPVDSDTAIADFTPNNGGSLYVELDDTLSGAADGDTTRVSSSTLGHKIRFGIADLSETPDSIIALQVVTEAEKTTANTRALTAHVYSGTTEGQGTEWGLTEGTYTRHVDTFTVNPDTGVAFTPAEVNGLQIGAEITT